MYQKLSKSLNDRSDYTEFFVSQAVFTPNGNAILKNTLAPGPMRKPSLFHWTEKQYEIGGPFDKWMKTLQPCRSRLTCCKNKTGLGNIVMRDFATRSFSSSLISKNFNWASGSELECEKQALAEEEAERQRLAEEKRLEAERIRQIAEEQARLAKEAKDAGKPLNGFSITGGCLLSCMTFFLHCSKISFFSFFAAKLTQLIK